MIKIYCDTGGYPKWLKPLIDQNKVKVFGWPYENKNKRIKNKGAPSKATWEGMKYVSWQEAEIRWSDTDESEKFQQIADIIGKDKVEDVKHLDSAYKLGCDYFLTSDRRHIIKHRKAIRKLLGLKVIDHRDREEILRGI